MSELVLVLNAGSSTLKFQVLEPGTRLVVVRGTVDRIGEGPVPDHAAALTEAHSQLSEHGLGRGADAFVAVGHRVVHGGSHLVDPVLVDDTVLSQIEAATHWAPLHNPPAVAGIRTARDAYPGVPQVAVFDTGFFSGLPAAAATYAVDRGLAEREGLRRFGAHGISHEYVAGEAAAFLGRDLSELDQVVLHLGNGASAAAVHGGRPVDTSMGLTPLEGLVMGTRGGDLDPGLLLHLLRSTDLDVDGLEDLLHHRSGLLGLTGTSDFRDVTHALDAGDERARLAYDVYCHRLRRYVGAFMAVLGGTDVITFTAGVGEHTPRLRADVLADLATFGIQVDPVRNRADATGARRISADSSLVEVLVVPTNEELAIARKAAALVGGGQAG